MTAGDFSSNRFMRSLRLRTERRRGERRRRSRTFVFLGLGLLGLMVLAAPSIVCNTPIGASLLRRSGAGYGWQLEAKGIQLGWITPLRLDGLRMKGPSGETVIQAESLRTNLTLMQWLRGVQDFGTVSVRDLDGTMTVAQGRSSLDDDLSAWFDSPSSTPAPRGRVEIQGATLTATDVQTGNLWRADQTQAIVLLEQAAVRVEAQTVLTDANGGSGAIEVTATLPATPTPLIAEPATAGTASSTAASVVWRIDVHTSGLPLPAAVLVKRRFPELTGAMPEQLDGDASGDVRLEMLEDGAVVATFHHFQLRNLVAVDPRLGTRVWTNHLAEINGSATYSGQRVIGRGLQAKTDFGTLLVSGAFATSQPAGGSLAWLEALDGTASAEVDLAALNRAAPGLMPLRQGVEITSGRVAATLESGTGRDQQYRSKWQIRSEPLRARASGRPVVLEAVEADATLRLSEGRIVTESVRLSSAFGTASGHGQLRSGAGKFHVNFGRLAAMLRPVIELPESTLAGIIEGQIRWDASAGDLWDLQGSASATDLALSLPGGRVLRQPTLNATVQATGRWAGQSLQQLTRATVNLQETRQRWTAELTQSVQQPSMQTLLPLRITGSGQLAALADLIGPWLPAELEQLDGGFKADMQADVAGHSGQLRRAAIDLDAPSGRWDQRNFAQPFLKIDFDGRWAWPSGDLLSRTLTVSGDAVSLAAKGEMTAEHADMELAWRMDLARVQRSVRPSVDTVATPSGGRRMAAKPVTEDRWLLQGNCDGRAVLKGSSGVWRIDTNASARDIALVQPAFDGLVGPARPGRDPAAASHVVWAEPNALLRGVFQYDRQTGHCTAENIKVSGDWFATTLSGQAAWKDATGRLRLKGPARLNMPVVAQRLTSLTGQGIQLTGTHETPLDIQVTCGDDSAVAVNIIGTVGWQEGEVAGVRFGQTSVPVRLTETTVFVDPATVPMDVGRLNLAGEVHYRPGPLWFEQRPGLFAEEVRLEPAMCRSWLKYLAPLVADATEVAGTFSVELDDALVVMDGTHRSRVAGRLKIQNVELNAGPLANQLINAVEQVRTISKGLQAQAPAARKPRRLLAMPPQTVDFAMADGVVNHQRLYLQIDDASLITSGAVALDGRLNLQAQVPLQSSWLGADLQGLAGQAVTLPVGGTLSRPSLDAGAVRQLVSQVGTAAVQQTAEHFLQQQTNKAMQKLFGR